MKLHKEGYVTIIVTFIVLLGLCTGLILILPSIIWLQSILILFALLFMLRVTHFFRSPNRQFERNKVVVFSPADGEIVAIEEVFEEEYLKQKCIQVSVFMSPRNVHINWLPISGKIEYFKYHPGKHLVAWHPKSSILNERTSIGVIMQNNTKIIVRQIAGAIARRIVCYAKEGMVMNQNDQLGFIKFGSRVDIFLPLDTEINVKLKDLVTGGQTVLAKLK